MAIDFSECSAVLPHFGQAVRTQAASWYYWVIKEHFGVELFCGITPLRARPTRKTLRGIHRGPGERRGARRPARTLKELLQRVRSDWMTAKAYGFVRRLVLGPERASQALI